MPALARMAPRGMAAGARKPPRDETVMGERLRCRRYGDLTVCLAAPSRYGRAACLSALPRERFSPVVPISELPLRSLMRRSG
jgi:hypothetical protein